MIEQGNLTWQSLKVLTELPYIGGRQVRGVPGTWSSTPPAHPPGLPTGAGTTLRQRAPGNRLAPSALNAQRFDLTGVAVESDDWTHLLKIHAAGEPVSYFAEWPISDVFRIRTDNPVRTHWQLSRAIPWDLFTATRYPVVAVVEDVQDSPTPTASETLTRIATGTPAAGEILIPDGERVVEVETADLAGEGPYRRLRIQYQPIYQTTMEAFDRTAGANGALTYRLTLAEHLPLRTYRATV